MAHFKHYLEVFRHHLNCFWPFQWKWKENVIFNKICLLFWTPFCNWPYSGHIYYLENVPVGPISPVWPLNVIWDFKNLIWSRKISIEIVLLLRHCASVAAMYLLVPLTPFLYWPPGSPLSSSSKGCIRQGTSRWEVDRVHYCE